MGELFTVTRCDNVVTYQDYQAAFLSRLCGNAPVEASRRFIDECFTGRRQAVPAQEPLQFGYDDLSTDKHYEVPITRRETRVKGQWNAPSRPHG
jgi:hypothetical protein